MLTTIKKSNYLYVRTLINFKAIIIFLLFCIINKKMLRNVLQSLISQRIVSYLKILQQLVVYTTLGSSINEPLHYLYRQSYFIYLFKHVILVCACRIANGILVRNMNTNLFKKRRRTCSCVHVQYRAGQCRCNAFASVRIFQMAISHIFVNFKDKFKIAPILIVLLSSMTLKTVTLSNGFQYIRKTKVFQYQFKHFIVVKGELLLLIKKAEQSKQDK